MPKTIIHVRGRESEWGVVSDMNQDQIDSMRADGIEVGELANIVPAWAADLGLTRPWCFVQDVWNLRNPWAQ